MNTDIIDLDINILPERSFKSMLLTNVSHYPIMSYQFNEPETIEDKTKAIVKGKVQELIYGFLD